MKYLNDVNLRSSSFPEILRNVILILFFSAFTTHSNANGTESTWGANCSTTPATNLNAMQISQFVNYTGTGYGYVTGTAPWLPMNSPGGSAAVVVAGIPAAATIIAAFLEEVYYEQAGNFCEESLTFNGTAITGTQIGFANLGIRWTNTAYGTTSINTSGAGNFCSVRYNVQPYITGNGTYTIRQPDGNWPSSTMSLIIVYQSLPSTTTTSVQVADGLFTWQTGDGAAPYLFVGDAPEPTNFSFCGNTCATIPTDTFTRLGGNQIVTDGVTILEGDDTFDVPGTNSPTVILTEPGGPVLGDTTDAVGGGPSWADMSTYTLPPSVVTAGTTSLEYWMSHALDENASDYKVTLWLNALVNEVSCSATTPTPTPTNTNTPTPTNTFTPTPTPTKTNTPTNTFTSTPTNTPTNTFTATPTPTNTNTLTPTPTPTNTNTTTPTFTNTPTNTPTDTPTRTNTPTNTFTPTFTNTPTNTPTRTNTPTNTFTATNTNTPTNTLVNTATPTNTPTMTDTFTVTNTPTNTFTLTNTPTYTLTNTPTNTFTQTNTPTNTPTNTFTDTPVNTYTQTNTFTNTPTLTATDTPLDTYTPTNTPTMTDTLTLTNTPMDTNTPTDTATNTFTQTLTNTPVDTNTFTNTPTLTATHTFTNTVINTNTATNTATTTFTSTPTYTPTATYTFTSSPTNSPTMTFTSTNTFTATPTVGVGLSKNVSKTQANGGDSLTYSIAVTVVGNSVNGLIVTDTLPANVTFAGFSSSNIVSGTYTASTSLLQWVMPSPLAAGIYTLSYQTTVATFVPANTILLNKAQVTGVNVPPINVSVPVTVVGNFTVKINIYNSAGEIVKTILVQQYTQPINNINLGSSNTITTLQGNGSTISIYYGGVLISTWDGSTNSGAPVSNGSYRIQVDNMGQSGVVTSVSQNAVVNRHLADITTSVYNGAGEEVRSLYSVVDDAVSSNMTNVTLSNNVIKPGLTSTSGTTTTNPGLATIFIETSGTPVTLTWDGTTNTGGIVTPGVYTILVHWDNGNGQTENISREIIVMAGVGNGGAVVARPNVLGPTNGTITTFDASTVQNASAIKVHIYTIAGQLVGTVTSSGGSLEVPWDATGKASGIYIGVAEVDNANGGVVTRQRLKILVLH